MCAVLRFLKPTRALRASNEDYPMADSKLNEAEEPTESEFEIEIKLEAQRDAAEDLKLTRQAGVKDVELEAKIDRLEAVGGLVEEVKAPAVGKGAFAHGDWRTRDKTMFTSADVEPAWYLKTEPAQQKQLQKMAGTYRPEGGVRALTRQRTRGNLKERSRLIDLGNAVLIRAGITKVAPRGPQWCLHCTGLIGPEMRSVSKFCCSDHRVQFFRAKAKLDADRLAGRVKDCRVADADMPFYFREPAAVTVPPMSAMYAIRSNQVSAFMQGRRTAL